MANATQQWGYHPTNPGGQIFDLKPGEKLPEGWSPVPLPGTHPNEAGAAGAGAAQQDPAAAQVQVLEARVKSLLETQAAGLKENQQLADALEKATEGLEAANRDLAARDAEIAALRAQLADAQAPSPAAEAPSSPETTEAAADPAAAGSTGGRTRRTAPT